MRTLFNENKQWLNSYYYLTNNKYTKEYFNDIEDQLWYTFYAMDWVCQIDFFIKFLNHRVIFITGSTGQGKSTQIPKLTLYALKALYYKNNGKAPNSTNQNGRKCWNAKKHQTKTILLLKIIKKIFPK